MNSLWPTVQQKFTQPWYGAQLRDVFPSNDVRNWGSQLTHDEEQEFDSEDY